MTAQPQQLVTIFQRLGATAEEAAKIRAVWETKPPNVIHQYPRTDASFPLFSIVLGAEGEAVKVMDNFGGYVGEYLGDEGGIGGGIGANNIVRTSVYTKTFHVMVYTDHPDVTLYYYYLAKYFITQEQNELQAQGVLDLALTGADMGPDQAYAPEWLFVRRLTITLKIEERVYDEGYPTITSVEGFEEVDGVSGVTLEEPIAEVTLPPLLGSE